jgi:hypothetical protein
MNDRLHAGVRPVVNESGVEIKPVYTAADVEASGGDGFIGEPGAYPFVRGIHPQMYRQRPYTMRQYTGFGNPAETNKRFKYLIENCRRSAGWIPTTRLPPARSGASAWPWIRSPMSKSPSTASISTRSRCRLPSTARRRS